MPQLRPEEEWARQTMEAELGVPVVQHDDGSRNRMHDLEVIYVDRAAGAVEVTSAVNEEQTSFWKAVNPPGGWLEPSLAGGWLVIARPGTKELRRRLPPFLRSLERAGIREFREDTPPAVPLGVPCPQGVDSATRTETSRPGSVYVIPDLPLDQRAGSIADNGDAVAEWVGDFLHSESRVDVRRKLRESGAGERHAFVIVAGFSGEPFSVTGMLTEEGEPIPTIEPSLPPEVTDVWVASSWAQGVGFRWESASRSWSAFAKRPLKEPNGESSPNSRSAHSGQ